ncbi:MAG: hypothetical protein WCC97_14400 [Candidatus Acidiferrales bacterium]
MFKAFSQQLHEQQGGSPLTPTLNPQTVARNFGVAYEVAESLPESEGAIRHAEDERESGLLLDTKKTPATKPALQPLLAIAIGRLRTINPRTPERAHLVAQLIADSQETLAAIDEMVATLDRERVEALETRLEELRTLGRAQRKHLDTLQSNVYTAMLVWNGAEEQKVKADSRLQIAIEHRRALRLDRFSSDEQLGAADEKVTSAVRKLNAAKDVHLRAERQKAEAENALALGQSELRAIGIAMDRCLAELKGQIYHDPETGLSVEPIAVRQ